MNACILSRPYPGPETSLWHIFLLGLWATEADVPEKHKNTTERDKMK